MDARRVDQSQDVFRQLAAVAGGRPDSRRCDRHRGSRRRAVSRSRHQTRHPVPGIYTRLEPRGVVLRGDALPQLADDRDWRPALRSISRPGDTGCHHRDGSGPGDGVAYPLLSAATGRALQNRRGRCSPGLSQSRGARRSR